MSFCLSLCCWCVAIYENCHASYFFQSVGFYLSVFLSVFVFFFVYVFLSVCVFLYACVFLAACMFPAACVFPAAFVFLSVCVFLFACVFLSVCMLLDARGLKPEHGLWQHRNVMSTLLCDQGLNNVIIILFKKIAKYINEVSALCF